MVEEGTAPGSSWLSFDLDRERSRLEAHLSQCFGFAVHLAEQPDGGFPDDLEAPGPTVIAAATFEDLAARMIPYSAAELALRFRANLEISGVEPFWEDRLYAVAGSVVEFQMGNVTFWGTNPCQRCVVPTRDPRTGKVDPHFARNFIAARQSSFPEWGERSRFNHFNRLTVNTRLADGSTGGTIRVGDPVRILGTRTV
jgi:hypothetical protein